MIESASSAVEVGGWEFGLEFVDRGGVRRLEPLSACWDVQFEGVAPVRSFRWSRGQRSFAGWWWSATTGGHVGFESWLERDHLMLLDFDPDVVGVASQPFWLSWAEDGRPRRHAPDFFVRGADGSGVVIDVRADDRVGLRDVETFEVTSRACARAGWGFRRVGTPDPVLVGNVRWLSRYRHRRCGRRRDVADRLVEVFAESKPLFAGAAEVGDRLSVLPVLYHLLWRQILSADLSGGALGPSCAVGPGAGGRW